MILLSQLVVVHHVCPPISLTCPICQSTPKRHTKCNVFMPMSPSLHLHLNLAATRLLYRSIHCLHLHVEIQHHVLYIHYPVLILQAHQRVNQFHSKSISSICNHNLYAREESFGLCRHFRYRQYINRHSTEVWVLCLLRRLHPPF